MRWDLRPPEFLIVLYATPLRTPVKYSVNRRKPVEAWLPVALYLFDLRRCALVHGLHIIARSSTLAMAA